MKKLLNNTNYIDIVEENGNTKSIAKESVKEVHLSLSALFLHLFDAEPYFLQYYEIENPLTPGVAYVSNQLLYNDLLTMLNL